MMVIVRTPFRISFFGGGTDYPVWFREHGGAVLATTINKYSYINCRYLPPFFEHKSRIVWSHIEMVQQNSEILHPAVNAAFKFMEVTEGIELHYDGDLPARSGLGSSSTFSVGVLHALHVLRGEMPSKMKLAREAIHLEQVLMQEHVGCQDQVMAAHGGLQRVDFRPDGEIQLTPMVLFGGHLAELQSNLMLFYTGQSRIASNIAAEQIKETPNNGRQLGRIRAMVDEAIELLANGTDLRAFGELLHEGWCLKRSLTERISNARIDDIYERARAAGAIGGKLMGAGGGGFMVFFVPPERQANVKSALGELLHVPFRFEDRGSHVIFYEQNGYHKDEENHVETRLVAR